MHRALNVSSGHTDCYDEHEEFVKCTVNQNDCRKASVGKVK